MRGSHVVAVLFGHILMTTLGSCLPQRKSATQSEAVVASLEVSGIVRTPGGAPVQGADLYIEQDAVPIAKSAGDGSFSFKLDEAALRDLKAKIPAESSSWRLYIKQLGTIELAGMGPVVSPAQKGSLNLGVITLQPAAVIKGVVLKANGNATTPASGAVITMGRERTSVTPNGTFSLSGLPYGRISVTIENAKFQSYAGELEITGGSNTFLEDPFVLFPDKTPRAVLIMQPWLASGAGLNTATTRSFRVIASPSVKFIRYSHNYYDLRQSSGMGSGQSGQGQSGPVIIDANGQPIPNNSGVIFNNPSAALNWRPLTPDFSYSFPGEGPASLWFQVADSTQAQQSDILQFNLNINSCEGFRGIVIGDGSGVVTKKKIQVGFDGLPPNATRVRLSEDVKSLIEKPWLALAPSLEYILSTGQQFEFLSATRQVFAQIGTTSGECPVVSTSVSLLTFPTASPGMMVINGGAPVSESRLVQVDIPGLPPNAFEMQLSEATVPTDDCRSSFGCDNKTPWLRVQPSTIFMFKGTGARSVNIQFRDVDGLISPQYGASINIVPSQVATFSISFAQINPLVTIFPPPPSRYLVMQFVPPQNAIGFRILEIVSDGGDPNLGNQGLGGPYVNTSPDDIYSLPWLNLVPVMPVYARGIGLRTFLVQYRGIDEVITSITQSILIAPVVESLGDFRINNGEDVSIFPTIKLYVNPPPTAVAMSPTNLTIQQTTANSSTIFVIGNSGTSSSSSTNDQWVALAPSMEFKLDSRGVQSIQMRFRDANGNVSTPAPVHSIIYDPHPPFPVGIKPFTINNDAAVTTSAAVKVQITAPESAYSYRIASDPNFTGVNEFREIPNIAKTTIPGASWKVYQFETDYILSTDAGPTILYLQFRNELGDRSNSYIDMIDYQPAP